jgi:FXSXX-COOH protein
MRSTDEASGVSSTVADVRDLSLADMLVSPSMLDQAVARVLPDSPVARVGVAAFNSAI